MPVGSSRSASLSDREQERTIHLRVICAPMPPKTFVRMREIELAMQYLQELRPGVEGEDGSMRFECEVRVKRNPKTGAPNFLGPWVHGTPDARHLYLNWQGREGDEAVEFRRMKVHLSPITWEQIEAVGASEATVLEARISGVGGDGGPACASVPLLDEGWVIRRSGVQAFGRSGDT